MSEEIRSEKGSGNIFKDIGFPDEVAEEYLLKAKLGAEIFRILRERNLTQTAAAKILGVKRTEISRLKAAKFSYYSVERLMRFLERLNCEVSIHIRPESEDAPRVIAI
jgi:predicted XRE-type DNA-binding protein